MNTAKGSAQSSEPWKEQQGYLTEGWRGASDLWKEKKDTPYFSGPTYAGPTDWQRQQLEVQKGTGDQIAQIGAFNTQKAQDLINRAMGHAFMGDVSAGADTYGGTGFNPSSSYRATAAPQAVSYVGSDQPILDRYRAAGYAERAPAPTNINATNYMTGAHGVSDNPYFMGGLEAAFTPAVNKFNREVLPGIKSAAISNGAYGGARQDISEGIAAAETQKNLADIAASAFLQQYGSERQIGSQQENLASQLSSAQKTKEAELAAQNWATAEQLGTSRYNTTEGLRAGDMNTANKLGVDWATSQNENNLKATLAANANALDWAKTLEGSNLQNALATDKNAMNWAMSQDQLGTQRWSQLQDEAAKRNQGRDTLNSAWDTSMLNAVPTLSNLGTSQWMQGQSSAGAAGAQEQQWNQQGMDAELNNWLNQQNWDWNNLKQYTGIVQGYNPGLVQNAAKNNPLSSIFGGAMGGALGGSTLGNLTGLFGQQSGAIGGGLLGALLGAF